MLLSRRSDDSIVIALKGYYLSKTHFWAAESGRHMELASEVTVELSLAV
jgi:hypothetical protein